jgi:DNA modification methylase
MAVTPTWQDPWLTVYQGDARAVLAELPAESVHCVVTSPPYFALRDYGVSGQIGLEPSVDEYVAAMVDVFREVRRVLRNDGTLWLNLGDSYAGVGAQTGGTNSKEVGRRADRMFAGGYRTLPVGVKQKDLYGIPWRVAFALQADGWYLRSDIIWNKNNPMPESVTDRPTKSHEYLFLLSKSPRYYYDADAVREGVFDLPDVAPVDGVPSSVEPSRPVVSMPTMFGSSDDGVASPSRISGEASGGAASLAAVRAGSRDEGEARSLRPQAADDGRVPGDPGWTRGAEAGAAEPEGSSPIRSVLPRSTDGDGWPVDVDGRGVGGDQDGAGLPLPLLRPAGPADNGSRHPGEQGRDAHEGERGGGLQALQQPQARSAHMAATPRNDGERWREVDGGVAARGSGRNLRSVWTIATQPYPGAHFATFPRKLVEPCIKAGTSERGVCPECGAPWERVVERQPVDRSRLTGVGVDSYAGTAGRAGTPAIRGIGWHPTCAHVSPLKPQPAVVLDPFAGSGTTGMVAQSLGRRAILIDLSADYRVQAMERNRDIPLGLGA